MGSSPKVERLLSSLPAPLNRLNNTLTEIQPPHFSASQIIFTFQSQSSIPSSMSSKSVPATITTERTSINDSRFPPALTSTNWLN
ncbi:unnamed protein product [Linum trigynum]|uniref:Uncharacterized protein n=1 Tax=Linum trigynum TaxID=586398 RepID=A0AAV2FNL8_9ROSI